MSFRLKSRKALFIFWALLGIASAIALAWCFPSWRADYCIAQGDKMLSQAKPEEALNAYKKAFFWQPHNRQLIAKAKPLLLKWDPETGQIWFERIAKSENNSLPDHITLIRLLEKNGNTQEARSQIETLFKQHPNNSQLLIFAGKQALEEEDWVSAGQYLQPAYETNPNDPETLYYWSVLLAHSSDAYNRVLAKAQLSSISAGDSPWSLLASAALLSKPNLPLTGRDIKLTFTRLQNAPDKEDILGDLSAADLRQLCLVAMNHLPRDDAYHYFKHYYDTAEDNPEHHADLIRTGIQLRVCSEIELLLKNKVQETEPTQQTEWALYTSLCQNDDFAISPETLNLFNTWITEEPNNAGIKPLLISLITTISKEHNSIKPLINLLATHPNATVTDWVSCYEHWLTISPTTSKASIFSHSAQTMRERFPNELLAWWQKHRAHEAIIQLYTEKDCADKPTWQQARYQALLGNKQPLKARAFLTKIESQNAPLNIAIMQCQQNLDAQQFNDAWNDWQRARALIEDTDLQWLALARLAHFLNKPQSCAESYDRAQENNEILNEMDWHAFFTATYRIQKYNESLLIAKAASNAFPENPYFINNAAYLSLLAHQETTEMTQRMISLVDTYPKEPSFTMTLALGYYLEGKSAEAIKIVERSGIDLSDKNPSNRALYSAFLAAEGKINLARSMVSGIKKNSVLPAEWKLIASFASDS